MKLWVSRPPLAADGAALCAAPAATSGSTLGSAASSPIATLVLLAGAVPHHQW